MLQLLPTPGAEFSAVCRSALVLSAFLLACGEQPESVNEITRVPDTDGTVLTGAQLPPMPSYPRARRGMLVTESAGDYDIRGSWLTEAGICDRIGIVEIYAGPPGLGTAMLLLMPDDDRVGEYPVAAAAADLPSAPAALIAVQVFDDPDGLGFQAYDGTLELHEIGETVSGRFSSTLREINLDILTHYVGVFEKIPVEPLTDDYCQLMEDSAFVSGANAGEG